jgi:general secretion pathway protein I
MSRRRQVRGFTLLEVLVALAIVAMSVGALLGTVTSSASNVIYLKDKTLAEWVALNRLTEARIDKNMPDKGKRTGNTVMAGMRWEWEEEVVELPIKGMFRIDVRAHSTGEFVDDSKPEEKPTAQTLSKSTPSGTSLEKTAWTSTVTGVVSSARSQRLTPYATPWVGSLQSNNPTNPGGAPGNGGGTPNNPGSPPTPTPTTPGTGLPTLPKPPPQDR